MVEAAYAPLVVLLVVVLVTGNLRVGIFAALGGGTLVLAGLGFFAARRAGGSRADAVKWSLVSASLGIVVILLKLFLH
jgi:mannose/fructose/N-acetylgalactosamine-specific phosphotransferase system component IIC